ncbi:MAG TPA: hypothetical protein VF070_05925, partial [Streptosporangiaceae bacterium]
MSACLVWPGGQVAELVVSPAAASCWMIRPAGAFAVLAGISVMAAVTSRQPVLAARYLRDSAAAWRIS